MIDIELIRRRILARVPGAGLILVPNGAPNSVGSLSVGPEEIVAVATLLKGGIGVRLLFERDRGRLARPG